MDPFSLLSIGSNILGSAFGYHDSKKRQAQAAAINRQQYDLARNSVKYRVQDAKNAGIHPLYALGAPVMSSSAVVAPGNSLGRDMMQMGQDFRDIARMRDARAQYDDAMKMRQMELQYRSAQVNKTDLENVGLRLDNEIKLQKLKTLKSSQNKGQNAPRVAPGTEYVLPGGQVVKPKAGETRASEYEDNYGEAGDSFLGPYYWNNLYRAWRDYYNYK